VKNKLSNYKIKINMKKKNNILICLIIVSIFLYHTSSCKKSEDKDNSKDSTTTIIHIPTLITSAISDISQTSATTGGNITSDGGSKIIRRGVCWSTNNLPTLDDNNATNGIDTGSFTISITGLGLNTKYFVRAFASNRAGIGYGDIKFFTTLNMLFNPNLTYGTLTDNDSNSYKTIIIGTQTWMAENLKVTHYRNGDSIPNITDYLTWDNLITGAYCDLDFKTYNSITYGRYYNFYAIADNRNVCPVGWHVPTDDEWTTLITYLGGETIAGGRLKETGTSHWSNPNTGATNESGFTALPAGELRASSFFDESARGVWWSSTSTSIDRALSHEVTNDSSIEYSFGWYKSSGYSVRCVKN
jgi:uncharacterized protein (TIGR02145 family)